jgi:hypothetical protein
MKKILDLVGMTVGGGLGWALGATTGIFGAFVVGMVGTGLGLYAVRRLTKGIT